MTTWKIATLALELPGGWTEKSPRSATNVTDPKSPLSLSVEHEQVAAGLSAKAYAATVGNLLKQQLKQYQSAGDTERQVAGQPAVLRRHSFSHQGAQNGQVQLYVIDGNNANTVTVGHFPDKGPQGLQAAEDIFKRMSFSVRKK
jgi:hypothetical protein